LSFSLIISSSFPCFDSFWVFIFLLASFFIISSLLWFCWATPHHVLSLLSLGLVTENLLELEVWDVDAWNSPPPTGRSCVTYPW
jgi:hypothetical protein